MKFVDEFPMTVTGKIQKKFKIVEAMGKQNWDSKFSTSAKLEHKYRGIW